MTTTITSKFRNSLWTAPIFLSVAVAILIGVIVYLADEDYRPSNAHQIILILVVLIAMIAINSYRAAKRFIKVTVSPDELRLHYLLTGKQRPIKYADIAHVSLRAEEAADYASTRRWSLIEVIKLKIELNTGETLYLFEEYYQNFDELKEAIRRARFGLA